MSSKTPASLPVQTLNMFPRRSRVFVALAAAAAFFFLSGLSGERTVAQRLGDLSRVIFQTPVWQDTSVVAASGEMKRKVSLEAHIMSKCPDAEMCLEEMILPAMMQVNDLVDFKLSFIGAVDAETGGVLCKHGPTECMGNIIELCAFELYPEPKTSLGFTACITRSYDHIPERALIQDCALEHGLDFDRLNECTQRDDGAHGVDMLKRSVTETKDAGVTKSCTVRVDDKVWCIADGGAWSQCPKGSSVKNLVEEIERLAKE